MTDYLDIKACSAHLKKELKDKWPSVSWSVRVDRGGHSSSLRVAWTDGPTEREVREIAGKYESSHFDGMSDCDRPTGNMVRVGGKLYAPLVRYVFPERAYTVEFLGAIARDYCQRRGYQVPEIKTREDGSSAYLVPDFAQMAQNGYETIAEEIHLEIKQISALGAGVKARIRKEVAHLKGFPETAPAPKQEQQAPTSEGSSSAPAIIHDRDWTWLHFTAQPAEATREAIKALGFVFSAKRSAIKGCSAWYAKSHVEPEAIQSAIQTAPEPQMPAPEEETEQAVTLWNEPEPPVQSEKEQIAASLEAKAAALDGQIEKKRQSSYYTNPHTHRQRAMADSIQHDIDRLEEQQTALRALAEAHRSGWVPWALLYVRTRAEVERLLARYDNGENTQAKSELRALLAKATLPVDQTARQIKELERDLIGTRIPGYFPTPQEIVEQMLQEAALADGMRVLEPSAGKGNIADAIRAQGWDITLHTIEYQHQLAEILRLKGHMIVARDFLAYHQGGYDRILMNPPFEKWEGHWQDIQHVQHAYDLLKPGGKLVAIMSAGALGREDKETATFRDWLEQVSCQVTRLPDKAFSQSERPTGVSTVLVVIQRDEEAMAESA